MREVLSGTGAPVIRLVPAAAAPTPRAPGHRRADRPASGCPRPLRLDQLPVLVLTGPAVEHLSGDSLQDVAGLERQEVVHAVAGRARRPEAISGVRLALSDAGLDRVAGLVALGADHTRGCLGARGVSLGEASRYAARLERLGLRAETAWRGLAEGYYVLDAEPWNLRRLVDEHAIAAAESLLDASPRREGPGRRPATTLVLLGPTCTTAAP